jgi:hypothetical protein
MNIRQSQAGRLTVEPKRQVDRAKRLRGQVRSVAPLGAGRTAPPAARTPPDAVAAAFPSTQTVVDVWAQTPWVEPGAAVDLVLCIAPLRRPTQDRDYAFRLLSRSAQQEEAVLTADEKRILLRRCSWFRLYGPALILGILFAAALAASFYTLWVLRFGALLLSSA